jgi:hypothetical protein
MYVTILINYHLFLVFNSKKNSQHPLLTVFAKKSLVEPSYSVVNLGREKRKASGFGS